jgi:sulfite exporter TauE/SafE
MLNWSELIMATISASLIGSLHCVGMCGPFAMMATHSRPGTPDQSYSKTAGYHLGRLSTYLMLGTLAGIAGALVNRAGQTMGMSQSAAKVVGLFMIVSGLVRLISIAQMRSQAVSHSPWLQRWTQNILSLGKRMQPVSPVHRAFVIGLITTWLPCGWLYLFAIAASSTGSIFGANALMIAFWIGTLPLLSIVAMGSASLGRHISNSTAPRNLFQGLLSKVSLQSIAACLMIGFGVYTYVHRAQIRLETLVPSGNNQSLTQASIRALTEESLPCCIGGIDTESLPKPEK